jgi:hypothetical protein
MPADAVAVHGLTAEFLANNAYAAALVLIAATTVKEADIERATAQMERALRRDNWL